MLSVEPKAFVVNNLRIDQCPACKKRLSQHAPSGRYPHRLEDGKIAVVNGRCLPGGERAPQKLSWVTLGEILTEAEYRERYTDRPPPLEPCPGCGGRLRYHGSFGRGLEEEKTALVNPLRIHRGLCPNEDCPVVTVTHYPSFVTPYEAAPTGRRESVVRERVETGRSWAELSVQAGYTPQTVRRWVRRVRARATEIAVGLLAVAQRLDPVADFQVAVTVMDAVGVGDPLPVMFQVADAVADLLSTAGAWRASIPCLCLPRLLRPPGLSPLPVWT